MAIWFLRLSAAICLTMTVGALGLVGQHWYQTSANEAELAAAKQHIRKLGGSFWTDVANGNHVIAIHDREIADAQIEQLVAILQPLRVEASHSLQVEPRFAFDLAGTNVGDRGVQALATLPLIWLNLNGTPITDEALANLRNQEHLNLVTVAGTKVTLPGIQEIQTALPQLWIPVTRSAN